MNLINLHIWPFFSATAQYQCLMAIETDSVLSNLCHNCGFACQKRVLKMFHGTGYPRSNDREVWSK